MLFMYLTTTFYKEGKETISNVKLELYPTSFSDVDNWHQGYRCGDIVPIYNIKKKSKIEVLVDTSDNLFDEFGNVDKIKGLRQSYSILKK